MRNKATPAADDYNTALSDVARAYSEMGAAANDTTPSIEDVERAMRKGEVAMQLLRDAMDGGAVRPSEAARLMFQEPRLLPWSRVIGNVEVGLGRSRKAADGRTQALERLAQVGLRDRARDWPAVLSGGQKQRVALARALVSRPRLLALDEPLGALDALTRIEMQRLLERVWLEQRFTAVLVTHDVAEAVALADRVVLVEEGVGDPSACEGSWVGGDDLWMLHAWVVPGYDNPAGVFAATNRKLCPPRRGNDAVTC